MAEWLERVLAVREVSGSSPSRGEYKIFADVGNLLTTSFSAGMSKNSGSIHLLHTIQSPGQPNNTPFKRFTIWNWFSVRSHQISLAHFLTNDL